MIVLYFQTALTRAEAFFLTSIFLFKQCIVKKNQALAVKHC